MTLELTVWAPAVFESVTAFSRTAQGESASAYGGQKPALRITDPKELEERVLANLRGAIVHVWTHGAIIRAHHEHILGFMNAVAAKVSSGLLQPGQSLWRTWDTSEQYPEQISPRDIPKAMLELSQNLASAFQNFSEVDPVALAGRLERDIDRHMHPFADGCGRSAKLLGAWVLLRAKLLPARFTNRKEYYATMNAGESQWLAYYRAHIPLMVPA